MQSTATSAIVLAGGRATRMDGADKGLVLWQGQPLIAQVLQRLQPQVADLHISCNRNFAAYQHFAPCHADLQPDFAGPLAGIAAALPHCQQAWTVVVACDMPLLPLDLVARLHAGRRDGDLLAVAHDGQHLQPLAMLLHRTLLPALQAAVASGQAGVQRWICQQAHVRVPFADPQAFANLNSLADLQQLASGNLQGLNGG